jgi:hypothetical protein
MKASKFSDEQIAMARRQAKAGHPVGEICRKFGSQGAELLSLEEAPCSRRGPRVIRGAEDPSA